MLPVAVERDPHDPARRGRHRGVRAAERRVLPTGAGLRPEGTIFNPDFPASCFARFSQVSRVFDSINLALAPVLPDARRRRLVGRPVRDRLLRTRRRTVSRTGSTSRSTRAPYGGRNGKDGMDAVDALMANTRNNPIEELELNHAMQALRYEACATSRRPPAGGAAASAACASG